MNEPNTAPTHSTYSNAISTMLTNRDIDFIKGLIDQRIEASDFIKRLIDQRIEASKLKKTAQPALIKNFHTLDMIRASILRFLPEFRKLVGNQPFPVGILRAFLKARLELLPGDIQMNVNDRNGDRFDKQVANALENWPDSPIIKCPGRKNRFVLIES